MDAVLAFLTDALGPLGPVYALAAVAAVSVAAAAAALLRRPEDPMDRMGRREDLAPARPLRARAAAPAALRRERGEGALDRLAPFLEPKGGEDLDDIRLRLLQAGYRGRGAVRAFHLVRGLLSVGLAALAALYFGVAAEGTAFSTFALGAGGALALGYLAPGYWIERRRQARQEEIANGFPDALDLMLICVEAGQSLDQALIKVAAEIQHAHPALAEEFAIISSEMRAGRDRPSVLRDFGRRAGVQDISSFVTVLVQSATFGTSVAEALRIYAAEMRDKRIMRAEEKANTLPTKLTLGTMFFTVPPLLLILIGPSLIDIINAVQGMAR